MSKEVKQEEDQHCYCGNIYRLGVIHRKDTFCDESPKQEQDDTDWEAVAADQALTIALLKSGLEQSEPVAWTRSGFIEDDDGRYIGKDEPEVVWGKEHPDPYESEWYPLYERPQPRKPLTDEQIAEIASTPAAIVGSYVHTFARAIEAAHGIKE